MLKEGSLENSKEVKTFDTLEAESQSNRSPRDIIAAAVRQNLNTADSSVVNSVVDKIMAGEMREDQLGISLFDIAESIENSKGGTARQQECSTWLKETRNIVDNMNDGMITRKDMGQRKQFLDYSGQRESDILVCLALYEKSGSPLAQKRREEMLTKLSCLRQLRGVIFRSTKTRQEVKREWKFRFRLRKKEQSVSDKLRTIEKVLQEIEKNKENLNFYVRARQKLLDISQEKDKEFLKNYSFYKRMLEEQKRCDEANQSASGDYASCLERLRHSQETREDVQRKIQLLSGRISVSNQVVQKRRAFDADKFRLLSELEACRSR